MSVAAVVCMFALDSQVLLPCMVAMHCRGAIEHTPVHSGDNLHSSCRKCWNKSAMMLKFLRDFCDTSKKPPLKASMI